MQACGSLEKTTFRPNIRKRTEAHHGTEAKATEVRDHLFRYREKDLSWWWDAVMLLHIRSIVNFYLLPLTGHQRLAKRGETSCSIYCLHTTRVVYRSHTLNTSFLCLVHCPQIRLDTTFSEILTGAKSHNVRLLYGMWTHRGDVATKRSWNVMAP